MAGGGSARHRRRRAARGRRRPGAGGARPSWRRPHQGAVESQAVGGLGRPVTIRAAVPRLLPRIGLELTGITIGAGARGHDRPGAPDDRLPRARSAAASRMRRSRSSAAASTCAGRSPARRARRFRATATAPRRLPRSRLSRSGRSRSATSRSSPAPARSLVDLDSSLTGGDRFMVSRLHGRSEGSDSARLRRARERGAADRDVHGRRADARPRWADGLSRRGDAGGRPRRARRRRRPARRRRRRPAATRDHRRARQGRALGIAFTELETTGRMKGGARRPRGPEDGSVRRPLRGFRRIHGSQREPRLRVAGHVRESRRARARRVRGLAGIDDGPARRTVALAAAGADPVQAIERARGHGARRGHRRRVPGLEIVRTVVLAFGKPSGERPAGSGEAFTRLAATLAVAG